MEIDRELRLLDDVAHQVDTARTHLTAMQAAHDAGAPYTAADFNAYASALYTAIEDLDVLHRCLIRV